MIKFFGSIRQKLLADNKLGKYLLYAAGEILLVVIGILIALQVNNWNENRIDRKEEARILEQLHEEFELNKEKLLFLNKKNDKVLQALQRVLAVIPINLETVNLDTLSSDLAETYDFNTFDPLEGTISELQNNSFDIISDKRLRSLLLSWNTIKEDFLDDEKYAIDYSKDYNKYMQQYISFDYGLKKPDADLSFLSSTPFENWVRVRQIYYLDLVDSEDYLRLKSLIEEVIELTSQNALDP